MPDAVELRRVFSTFPTGVVAMAGLVEDQPVGLAASSFVSVSLDPPLVSVCVAHTSRTWPVLRRTPRLGISVLGVDQEQAGRQLSGPGADRFAGLSWTATAAGAVLLRGASAWLECGVERDVPAGDHDIVLLRVHELSADAQVPPLVFHGSTYRRLADRLDRSA